MRHTILRVGVVAALAALVTGAAVSAAPASPPVVTMTSITGPANHSYYGYDLDSDTAQLTITGTSDGTTGDMVDIRCYGGASSTVVASNVAVGADGAFSIGALLHPLQKKLCTLRAVPAGTTPVSVSPFQGPTIGVGQKRTDTDTTPYDFYIWGQQAKGAFDYDSSTGCGVDDGYLFDATLAQTTTTFYCDAWLNSKEKQAATRSELRVDGANAYGPDTAEIINGNATGRPGLVFSYSVDKKTGNLVIHETDPIVKCADATYPPTGASCATFLSTGVTEHRTVVQNHDGLLAWVTDVFTSTDGKTHKLDLLYENDNYFGVNGNASSIEYKFPGQSSYATASLGQSIPLPPKPGTVLIRVQGSGDGDTSTGRGAIVYDRPASSAEITYLSGSSENTFELHQKATVPKKGGARFRFAFAQAYTQATVDKLAKLATVTFAGCTVPNVVGKSLAAAKKALRKAHCGPGRIRLTASGTIAKGTVVAEDPAAGTHVDYGTKVSLIVSKG